MILSRRLSGWVALIAAVIGTLVAPAAACGAVTVTVGRAEQGTRTAAEPHATGTNPSSVMLDLCAGPTPTCPASGYVNPPNTPTLTMSYGQDWNGSVVVTAADGLALTGQIDISWSYNGGPPVVICTLPALTGGTCPSGVGTTEGTSLGTNTITATYEGDADHAPSSSTVVITVVQDTTSATLTGSPNPQTAGQPVTLTATMTGSNAAPTGTVTFSYGGSVIGTGTLVAGTPIPGGGFPSTATMTTSTLPVGTDTITATYTGTPDFAGASATTTETITPAVAGSFTLSVTPDPVTIGVGYGGVLTVSVTPKNGFLQDVKLTCGNLPQDTTCLLVNPTIAGGSGSTQMIVQTTAPHSCGTSAPYFLGRNGGPGPLLGLRGAPIAIPAMAGLLALFVPVRRRRWLKLLIALVAIAGAMQVSGCGNCTDLGTRPATYSIEVTGTAQGGSGTPASAAQAVQITVTI